MNANGFGSLKDAFEAVSLPKHRVCIVGDSNTMPLYGEEVREALLPIFTEVETYTIPAGEEYKTLDTIRALLAFLIEHHFDRKDCLVALGGGVIGDMTGFAAAVYLRGIPVIQLPTTLLAQIDSSIGGKTAVDFDGYKNMVGAFHMPELIYTNPLTLKTLPREQVTSGLGEVIKSALLGNEPFYAWLRENRDAVCRMDDDVMLEVIRQTAQIKLDIVRRDPTEQGERAFLNFGHTIGHAVEKYKNFTMQHGTCVGLGMISAAYLSWKRHLISEEDYQEIRRTCSSFGLPLTTPGLDIDEILRITKSDKKMNHGQVRFILLESIGKACLCDDITDEELREAICCIMEEEA